MDNNTFSWKGEIAYDNGDWYYSNKTSWSVNDKSNSYLIKKVTELNKKGDEMIKNFSNSDPNFPGTFSFKDQPFLKWLSDKSESMTKVNRIMSTCLNHFSEILSDPLKINKKKYSFISSIVRQNMTVHIEGADFNRWFYLNSIDKTQSPNKIKNDLFLETLYQYFLALPEYFYKNEDIPSLIRVLQSHRVRQVVTFNLVAENRINFRTNGEICQYDKGYVCNCLPIPGKEREEKKNFNEPEVVKTPEIVVTSSNVTDALLLLSQVWNDKFAESILISAPPGSGKEQFAKSIVYGTGHLDNKNKDISAIAFPMGKQEDLEKLLYGFKGANGKVIRGVIANSDPGVVFLDEVHYPEKEPGIRASLLRPLESKEFIPIGAKETDKVKINNVLFVLATSKPLKGKRGELGLNKVPPVDFWTRMTHVLQILHPFEGIWGESIDIIVENYFIFFWWERLEKYFKIDPETKKDLQTKPAKKDTLHVDYNMLQRRAQMDKLQDMEKLKNLSQLFRKKLYLILKEERIQLHELSIRGFRNIVTRIFSISASEIVQGEDFDISKLENCIEPIIYEILEIAKLDL